MVTSTQKGYSPMVQYLATVPYSPVSNVQPFTYRDGATYLDILSDFQDYVRDQFAIIDNRDNTDSQAWHDAINALSDQFNDALNSLRDELTKMVEGSHDESLAFDPTNGTRTEGLSTVVSRVYDNLRLYGIFASQFDAKGYTCAEFESMGWSARHFDLAVTYPQRNDVLDPDMIANTDLIAGN